LVFGSPFVGADEVSEVIDCLQSGWIGTGPKAHRFERMLEEYIGVSHVRCLSSCTAALFVALKLIGVGALPVATEISNRTLSLPLSPEITRKGREDVCAALTAACQDRT
jgi:dTDP-4-amino-4,6-dideoxygalactose transaminase